MKPMNINFVGYSERTSAGKTEQFFGLFTLCCARGSALMIMGDSAKESQNGRTVPLGNRDDRSCTFTYKFCEQQQLRQTTRHKLFVPLIPNWSEHTAAFY
jgi:hypothetical protein